MVQDLSKIVPKLIVGGLKVLRESAVGPRACNRGYESTAGNQGSTIDVPIPSAVPAQDVVPAATPQVSNDSNPTTVPIVLDKWKEAPFWLDDKQEREIAESADFIPMQASSAIRSLTNAVDLDILTKAYQAAYRFVGGNGYVPFDPTANGNLGSTKTATDARKVLTKALAPYEDRHFLTTPDVEGNALQLRAFQDASWSGSIEAIVKGNLNEKLGFKFWTDQNIPSYTVGTLTASPTATGTAGQSTVAVSTGAGGAATLNPGDLIKFANHTQVYVCTSAINLGASAGPATLSISPALVTGVTAQVISHPTTDTAGNTVTIANGNSLFNSVAWQRGGVAMASRPFSKVPDGLGAITRTVVDEVTGLALRLEVTREHKRLRYSYDILWGVGVIRPELLVRILAAF